eukprot:232862-Prorocentrum_minimum.AAC.1
MKTARGGGSYSLVEDDSHVSLKKNKRQSQVSLRRSVHSSVHSSVPECIEEDNEADLSPDHSILRPLSEECPNALAYAAHSLVSPYMQVL